GQETFFRSVKGQANPTPTQKRVRFRRYIQSRHRFITSDVKGSHNEWPLQDGGHFLVDGTLRFLRWQTMRSDQFRAEQSNSFGSHLNRFVCLGQRPDVGEYLDPDPVSGRARSVPVDLEILPVTLCYQQACLYLAAARLIGSDGYRPAISIHSKCCALVDLGER